MNNSFIKEGKDLQEEESKNITNSIENVDKKYWDKDHIDRCISGIKNKKHKMLLQLMWMTGVRVSEAVSIKKRDIDFDNYTIQIKWQKSKKGRTRNIPLHPQLKEILDYYCGNMNQEDYLFEMGRNRAFILAKKYLGGNPHKLRHSFAVHWLRSGNRLETLSRVLGHSDIKTTMQYLQIVPQDQGKEMLNMDF